MQKELLGVSKFLSYVLRHKPEGIGLTLDNEGWADIEELIECAEIHQKTEKYPLLTKAILDEVVETNDKKRFEYSKDGWKIRASQGHSLNNVKIKMDAKTPPQYLYHGTAKKSVEVILKSGLKKMNRNHVHLNEDPNQSAIVGKRHGEPIVLKVNAMEMRADGYKFYLSANNVWLTDSVPTKYLKEND